MRIKFTKKSKYHKTNLLRVCFYRRDFKGALMLNAYLFFACQVGDFKVFDTLNALEVMESLQEWINQRSLKWKL